MVHGIVSIAVTTAAAAFTLAVQSGSPGVARAGHARSIAPQPVPSGWPSYAKDAYHDAIAPTASQDLGHIRWFKPVDLNPQYSNGELLIHYGSPLITDSNTILVTVKTGATGGFRVDGCRSSDGFALWTFDTDYVLPPHDWTPSCGSTLTPSGVLAIPGSGGTIYLRSSPDLASGTFQQLAFYGIANYEANRSAYDANVIIDTPISSDAAGNLYFGFLVQGSTPIGLSSGIARISSSGAGSWTPASVAAADSNIRRVVYNCAPAVSRDGAYVYVAVTDTAASGFGSGYLLRLDSTTLAQHSRVRLKDVASSSSDAYLPDDGTASPTVGLDGDVYFGVLENPFPNNNDRGWLLHFTGDLGTRKTPGAFGWDDTASIVPSAAVPSYAGSSTYLVLTKYNNYGGVGSGDGHNKVAILDPNATETDPVTGAIVMKEILTVLGPTPDPSFPGGVDEWCINTAAVDVARKSALVNSEDGRLYRWSFVTNTLSQAITLTGGLGEAYTPTLVGPDGTVYAISNATLFAVGR
jgi:hypothetical protein